MAYKSFTTRRQWNNTLLMAWLIPFLLLIGILLLAMYGTVLGAVIALVLIVAGLIVALVRDLGDRCYYSFKNNVITLETRSARRVIPMEDIVDASLIDRIAAREYLRGQLASKGIQTRKERRAQVKNYVRYCTVDIGFTSLTFGIGRSVTDRMPLSKYDLVLLRLKGGEDHLLSPKYNQDLVDTVSRMLAARKYPPQ